MQKNKPHYRLDVIKEFVDMAGKRSFTRTALFNSLAMGLRGNEAIDVILSITSGMFYKSMTTTFDHTIWQDVYHVPCLNGKIAYVKFTLRDETVVIQFKEK